MDDYEKILSKDSLNEEDRQKIRSALKTLQWLQGEIKTKTVSMNRLQKMLFGSDKNEKTENLVQLSKGKGQEQGSSNIEEGGFADDGEPPPAGPKKRKGHGRNGQEKYVGAERVSVPHEALSHGDPCPDKGCRGKVYRQPTPQTIICITGQAPLKAKAFELEKLRCNLCGKVFVAKLPKGVRNRKYDETAAAMIGLLKYGSGCPFNRIEKLEGNLRVPLPATTQWQIVSGASEELLPVYTEMLRQAADGDVLCNDDTKARILAHMAENEIFRRTSEKEKPRTGTFTSTIISRILEHAITLFFTGRKHAGENLEELLARRSKELDFPIQMSDAEPRNNPKGRIPTKQANCLAHGRRKFVEVNEAFPNEVRFVLEEISKIYKIESEANLANLSDQERLLLHQRESKSVMDGLKEWFDEQILEKRVEPNSSLGQAIEYMRTHWEKLTLFLREPGAPIDNNISERALKKPILHRKNSLFFKTEKGAKVADIFMSLIYTAEQAGANAFEYLTTLLRNARAIAENPAAWMPWNFKPALPDRTS